MGYHVSWIGIKGKSIQSILDELNIREIEKKDPYLKRGDIVGIELTSGWYVVYFNDAPFDPARGWPGDLNEELLCQLSKNASLITCIVEECSNVSSANGFNSGVNTWSILHDGAGNNLESYGDLPVCYNEVYQNILAEFNADPQTWDYLFSVPIEVCKAITGFSNYKFEEDLGDPKLILLEFN